MLKMSVEDFNYVFGLEYVLDFSLGYTKYLSKETYKEFLSRMYANMYIDKNKKKAVLKI